MMGCLTRKVVALGIKSKLCHACTAFSNINKRTAEDVIPDHTCWKNHNGSSGSMEAAVCLELVVELYNTKHVIIKRLCCDDDSSVRADCQWSNKDFMNNRNTVVIPQVEKRVGINKGELQARPDKGKLPANVPQPLFVADPNHQRKGLTGELIALDKGKVKERLTMTRMDSTRIGKNFGYMARTLLNKPESEYCQSAKAVLEHHFDNHQYCGPWCRRKGELLSGTITTKFYRCKKKNADLYELLSSKIECFITLDKLIEMAHGLDTNMNEAFNQICTWYSPKNKVFAGTGSLANRISFAVGINSVGIHVFFKRWLFISLGITMTTNVHHFLKLKERKRRKRLANVRGSVSKGS
jgi:hypothetical protein